MAKLDVTVKESIVNEVMSKMGLLEGIEKEPFEKAVNRSANWLLDDIVRKPDYSVAEDTTEASLIAERARYDMSNSLDIFERNYNDIIVMVIEKFALDDFIENGGAE